MSGFLQDDNGKFSAARLAMLLWTIGVLGTWIYDSITKARTLQDIPQGVVVVIGILVTGKVVQKYGENKPDATCQDPESPAK